MKSYQLVQEFHSRNAKWVLAWDNTSLTLDAPTGERVLEAPLTTIHRLVAVHQLLVRGQICFVAPHGLLTFKKNSLALSAVRRLVERGLADDPEFCAKLSRDSLWGMLGGLAMFLVGGGLFALYCWNASSIPDPPPGHWFRWVGWLIGWTLIVLLAFGLFGPFAVFLGLRQWLWTWRIERRRAKVRQIESGEASDRRLYSDVNALPPKWTGQWASESQLDANDSKTTRGYLGWYQRQSMWIKLVLFPVLIPFMLVHALCVMIFVLGLMIPFLTVTSGWKNHRLWRRLRQQGRVANWADVEPRIVAGSDTLLLTMGPNGPGCAWLIERPRSVIDPESIVPTLADYEWDDLENFDTPAAWKRIEDWKMNQLQPFESTAPVLVPTHSQLTNLPDAAKRGAVLVVYGWRRGFDELGNCK